MNIKVDAKGLKCPEPIMLLHKAIRESRHGDVIEVFATDPSTERDIDKFCDDFPKVINGEPLASFRC